MTFLNKLKGRQRQVAVVFLTGLLLLVISLPVKENPEEGGRETQQKEIKEDAYQAELENKLEQALGEMEGVGDVEVMMTFAASSEKVVEKDEKSTVYERPPGGGETPYIVREVFAKPSGILVVAEGGGNPVTDKNIREAVQALFGIEAHKIKIMKMSKKARRISK